MWTPQTLFEPSSYDDLITGKIPALIVPGILSKTECSSLCDRIRNIRTINENPRKLISELIDISDPNPLNETVFILPEGILSNI